MWKSSNISPVQVDSIRVALLSIDARHFIARFWLPTPNLYLSTTIAGACASEADETRFRRGTREQASVSVRGETRGKARIELGYVQGAITKTVQAPMPQVVYGMFSMIDCPRHCFKGRATVTGAGGPYVPHPRMDTLRI